MIMILCSRLTNTTLVILILVTLSLNCSPGQPLELDIATELGQAIVAEDVYGNFYTYLPATLSPETPILVLVHGTPAEDQTAEQTAQYYIESWLDFADQHGWILIAPAFNQEDFSSRLGDHAQGGYRGLFGREIMADDWVLRLVQAYQKAYGLSDPQFYLYGHSAGGQFVGRFLVTHPEKVKQAVISAAATYPQPDPQIAWPFGMGELTSDIQWDDGTQTPVNIVPNKQSWLAATQIPLTVIVGLNDTAEIPVYPGQMGKNRFVIGRSWVRDMQRFAQQNGLESQIRFELIPAKGHSMTGLLPFSQAALFLR